MISDLTIGLAVAVELGDTFKAGNPSALLALGVALAAPSAPLPARSRPTTTVLADTRRSVIGRDLARAGESPVGSE
jgi:hypothetical protein